MSELKKQIEAILFASGKKVTYEDLARLCNTDISSVKDAVQDLKKGYEEKDSPLILTEEADGWKMTVREKYLSLVHKMLPETELSKSVLETLAVIAWKQPVLQSEVIRIRTNKAYEDISELVERGFISKEKSGRSYLLRVTNKFKEYFELPSKEAIKKVFKDIQEHIKQEEARGEETEHLGKLEVYEEESQEKKESPHLKFYDHQVSEKEETKKGEQEEEEKEETEEEQPGEKEGEEEQAKQKEIEEKISEIAKAREEIAGAAEESGESAEKEKRPEEEKEKEKEPSELEEIYEGVKESKEPEKKEKKEEEEAKIKGRELSSELEEFIEPEEEEKEDEE